MKIALSGTPGTGKTCIARILERKYHINTIHLHHFAMQENLIEDYDEKRRSDIIDIDSLNKRIIKKTKDESLVLIDGHLSHFLTCIDMVIVLRCHPRVLKNRLKEKQWSTGKINENLQAEMLDVIESEAVDIHTMDRVIEIDTSEQMIEDLVDIIHLLITTNFKDKHQYHPGQIDWTDLLMSDEFSWRDTEEWS
jgi:adenylate kinase